MTAQEFSSEFDLLYNNISSAQAPGLTEYEKSVFLTKAQDEIIKNYFTNVQGGNKYQQGIEDSAKRYADFSALVTIATLSAETDRTKCFDERGLIFKLPNGQAGAPKALITISEKFMTGNIPSEKVNPVYTTYQVVSVKFDEYLKLMSKPSSDPLKKQVWKLMGNSASGNGSIEIVRHWKDKNNTENVLVIRYIRKPYPIILENLISQDLSIEGYQTPFAGGGKKSDYEVKTIKEATDGKEDGIYAIMYIPNQTIFPRVYTTSAKASSSIEDLVASSNVCELAEELHSEILQRAVELAKIFYTGDNQQILTTGTRSE